VTRRDAWNRYLKTPKITYEGILMDAFYLQQQQKAEIEAAQRAILELQLQRRLCDNG
jgi:hypothetical protein